VTVAGLALALLVVSVVGTAILAAILAAGRRVHGGPPPGSLERDEDQEPPDFR